MKKTIVALSLVTAMFALESDYNYEITPMIGGAMPEGNLDLDDQISYGLRIGRHLDDYFFNTVEFGFDYSNEVNYKNSNIDTNILRFSVNLLKDFDLSDKFAAYGLIGVGYEAFTNEQFNNETGFAGRYGAGLKYKFSDRLALRAEVVDQIKFEHADHHLLYTLGLGYSFGSKKAPEPVVVDDDGDGVVNEKDLCPNTPLGVEVDPNGCPFDDDKDGVPNYLDQCPNTPEGVEVDPNGCPFDDDKDGVPNYLDKCPGTPEGVSVDEDGCAKTITLHVNFDFDSANVKDEYLSKVQEVADFMQTNSVYNVVLVGHTDDTGAEAYNQKLSIKRAEAVAKALESQGVDASRIKTTGFGELNPIAPNDTKEGRAENRRVEADFDDN